MIFPDLDRLSVAVGWVDGVDGVGVAVGAPEDWEWAGVGAASAGVVAVSSLPRAVAVTSIRSSDGVSRSTGWSSADVSVDEFWPRGSSPTSSSVPFKMASSSSPFIVSRLEMIWYFGVDHLDWTVPYKEEFR